MSNDSNKNLNIVNNAMNFEKPNAEKLPISTEISEELERNIRFNLRKKKKINYSITRPDFLYESLSDSEFEEYQNRK